MFLIGRRRASGVADAFNTFFSETATRLSLALELALDLYPELLSWHLRRVAVDEASPDLKASIAARAFPLRNSEDEMGISCKLFEGSVPQQLGRDRETPPTIQRRACFYLQPQQLRRCNFDTWEICISLGSSFSRHRHSTINFVLSFVFFQL